MTATMTEFANQEKEILDSDYKKCWMKLKQELECRYEFYNAKTIEAEQCLTDDLGHIRESVQREYERNEAISNALYDVLLDMRVYEKEIDHD